MIRVSARPNSAIVYAYDPLGRQISRTVAGGGTETLQFDALGRVTIDTNDLGSFALSYLGQTNQITQRQLLPAGSSLATTWAYLGNNGDRRLASITNVGLASSQFSTYQFTTTPESFISSTIETSDAAAAYPSVLQQTGAYNNLNQLASLSGQPLSYDLDGNLLSDGQRSYSWDAENRLVTVTYPTTPGKQTTFTYDGLGRRTAITSTPAGGSAVTTAYIWCGSQLCQARNAANALAREYFNQGEFIPGASATTLYYGVDQIGSVRRVFTSTSNAPAFNYDPYGSALQPTTTIADFGFAGMFYNADSGLSLTHHRVYDSATGRWLSRDPAGEVGDKLANLYAYVANDPVDNIDPAGLFGFGAGFGGSVEGGTYTIGAGATGSVGAGAFFNGWRPSLGAFASFGAFAQAFFDHGVAYPSCPDNNNWAVGAYAGGGAQLFLTNANTVSDLRGPFKTYSGNFAWGLRAIGVQYSTGTNSAGQPIWIFNYGGPIGPFPTGGGYGGSISGYNTNTGTIGDGR